MFKYSLINNNTISRTQNKIIQTTTKASVIHVKFNINSIILNKYYHFDNKSIKY